MSATRRLTAGCLVIGLSTACAIGVTRDARAGETPPAQPLPKLAPAAENPATKRGAFKVARRRVPLPPARPQTIKGDTAVGDGWEHAPLELASLPDDVDQTGSIPVVPLVSGKEGGTPRSPAAAGTDVDTLISMHAARYHVPETLLRRIVARESGFNPHLRHGPFVGLMQMRLDTARGMGYRGGPAGLLDADTNLTYGCAYLANAYKVAGGNQERAVRLYSSGYYYEAKRKGLLPKLIKGLPSR